MKKAFVTVFASVLIMASAAACAAYPSDMTGHTTAPASGAASTAASEPATADSDAEAGAAETAETAEAPEPSPEDAADEMVLIRINTDGPGEIAFSEDGQTPVFNEEFPASSAFTHVAKGSAVALSARGQENYRFVKWMQDGQYYSGDADIAPTVEEDTEFIAVFGMSSGFEGPAVTDIGDAKTMADVLPLPCWSQSVTGEYFVYTFDLNGLMYRAVANLSPDTADALFALDFEDPEYDRKHNEITAPLPIDRLDCLTDMIPPQEELDAYAGKTIGELLDSGWSMSWFNLEDMEAGMEKGLFAYTVAFEGEPDRSGEIDDDTVRPMTVTAVTYDRLGDDTADLEAGAE